MAATPDKYEFRTYFENIAQKYQNWSNLYTLTDAVGKQQVDMLLMVELIQYKQNEKEQEKSERLPVLEAIYKYRHDHVLLVGKPGSGKSTALQRLLWEKASKNCTSEEDVIPVLVELRSWLPETASVIKLIQKVFRQNKLRLDEHQIEDLLFDGKLLLLLDGVNELPSDESRRLVAEFRQDYSQTPMIFTTRDLGVGGDLGIQKQLSMQPLTQEQMHQFIEAYLPEQGEEVMRQLNDKLEKFAEVPLLLWMLCGVYKQSGKIPTNLGESFRSFTNIYDNRLKADVPSYDNYHKWCRNLLEVLAYQMMSGTTETELRLNIDKPLAEDILTEYLEQQKFDKPRDYAKRWLEDLLEHHLISMVDNEKIEFRHQLFQEYYAAEYLLRLLPQLSDEKLKKDYLNLLKWTEPLALMLALLDEKTQAVRVVHLALDVDLMLGARLAGEVQIKFQEKTVGLILQRKLQKRLEVDFLEVTRSKFAVNPLINALSDEDSDVRSSAAYALGEIGNEAAVNPLINALSDEDSSARISAASALGKIKNEAAANPIINALNDEDSSARISIAYALSKIGNESAVNLLINLLNDEDLSVGVFAASILGRIGNEAAVNLLINASNDKDSSVCSYAASALDEIRNKAAVNHLINILNDENLSVRSYVASTLGKIGNKAAINLLINALNDEDSYIRSCAASALGKIGNEAAVNPLINALNDEDSYVRSCAASALGKIANSSNLLQMWDILLNGQYNAKNIILNIQERYKFYNHDIFHCPSVEETSKTNPPNCPNNNIFYGDVGAVNTGTVNNQGNQIGIQYNQQSE